MNERLLLHLAKQLLLKPAEHDNMMYKNMQSFAKSGDIDHIKEGLKFIADQASEPKTYRQAMEGFGENLVNIALTMFPDIKPPPLTPL